MARTATYTIDNSASTTAVPIKPIQWNKTAGGFPPGRLIDENTGRPYLAAAGQYFANGDMVYLNAGAVTERLTAGTGPIAGFVVSGGSADGTTVVATGAEIEIMPVNSIDEYEMNLYYSATEANQQRQDVLALAGNIYNVAQVKFYNFGGTSYEYCAVVDAFAATMARVKIVGIIEGPKSNATETYPRVRVKFLSIVNVSGTSTYEGLQF